MQTVYFIMFFTQMAQEQVSNLIFISAQNKQTLKMLSQQKSMIKNRD